jgi:hypothetical protein
MDFDRAVAPAISHWLPTMVAWVCARVWSSGICGGQSGAGAGFLGVLRFPLPIFISPNFPSSQSPRAYTIGQKWRHAEWTQYGLHPPTMQIKKRYEFSMAQCVPVTPVFILLICKSHLLWNPAKIIHLDFRGQ